MMILVRTEKSVMSCMETEPQGDYVIEHITLCVILLLLIIIIMMMIQNTQVSF